MRYLCGKVTCTWPELDWVASFVTFRYSGQRLKRSIRYNLGPGGFHWTKLFDSLVVDFALLTRIGLHSFCFCLGLHLNYYTQKSKPPMAKYKSNGTGWKQVRKRARLFWCCLATNVHNDLPRCSWSCLRHVALSFCARQGIVGLLTQNWISKV